MWFLERFLWPCSDCQRVIVQQKENCRQEATGSEEARRKRASLETNAVMESGCKLKSGSVLGNGNGRERKVKIQELFGNENRQEIKWMMRLQMWERERERQCMCPWLEPKTSQCTGQSILKMSRIGPKSAWFQSQFSFHFSTLQGSLTSTVTTPPVATRNPSINARSPMGIYLQTHICMHTSTHLGMAKYHFFFQTLIQLSCLGRLLSFPHLKIVSF